MLNIQHFPSLSRTLTCLSSSFRLITVADGFLAQGVGGSQHISGGFLCSLDVLSALCAGLYPKASCWGCLCTFLTFLTVLALVAGVADAGAHDAGAMVAAGHVNTLVGGHIALGALPAAVAQAPALHVLAVPTTEHGAGGWGDSKGSLA